ncbi:MAG: terpene cyclase/mutase family protein [Lentisphaerales bacterium]|nr:terpene cyclase/mutase family protein [Lentisphaerales bacterium]
MNEFDTSSAELDYEDDYNDVLYADDILAIQEEYRRKRLIESLIGPLVSTLFHVALIIILAIVITDKYKAEPAEIEVKIEEIEEVEIEEPPPIEEPVPEEVEKTDVTDPVLTTVAIETVETNDAALEDVSDEEPSTEDDSEIEAVSDVTLSASAFASPSLFGGRSAAGRASAVSAFGGSKVGQQALGKALWWLKKVQNPDGSWGKNQKSSMTSLAVLTFLAHGETTLSKDFGKTVQQGIEWLCKIVEGSNGKIIHQNGYSNSSRSVYSHGLVAYALSEATAMIGASQIEAAMNQAIKLVVNKQHPNGGYHYSYKNNGPSNLSNASYNYQALKAAYAAGSDVPGLKKAIDKAIAHMQEYAKENVFYYKTDVSNPRGPSMRAVGVLCLQLLGAPDCAAALRIGKYMEENDVQYLKWVGESGHATNAFPLYMWYYATQVMFQRGGKAWKVWRPKFEKLLVSNQNPEGYWESPSAFEADRFNMPGIDKQVYSTAKCALMLTVYYRYLPSFKLPKSAKKEEKKKKTVDEIGLDLIE